MTVAGQIEERGLVSTVPTEVYLAYEDRAKEIAARAVTETPTAIKNAILRFALEARLSVAEGQSPVAWLDKRTAHLAWDDGKVVATNPEYVENNGPENFSPLVALTELQHRREAEAGTPAFRAGYTDASNSTPNPFGPPGSLAHSLWEEGRNCAIEEASDFDVAGTTSDGVDVLAPAHPATHFTTEQARDAVRTAMLAASPSPPASGVRVNVPELIEALKLANNTLLSACIHLEEWPSDDDESQRSKAARIAAAADAAATVVRSAIGEHP